MSLDEIWKFVRYLLRRKIINAHEAQSLMMRIIEKRILLNDKDVGMSNIFESEEETPF